jgi:3-hydroxyacyl-CoA dehydrogenase
LFDQDPHASTRARESISGQFDKLVSKGKLDATAAAACVARLALPATLAELSDCELVIEAIVERLEVKKALFTELESIVSAQAVMVTNTSSLSVTTIAAGLKHPERFAGYHFFNPVPLMKVVEVIRGLKTSAECCEGLTQYARQMGHTPVQAQDTPGFIVNHAGRGYGTEALRIVSEGIADFAIIDRILKDQAGFKLGPFELMDLTALDVSHPVMESIYHQYFEEPRYRPSVITAQRLADERRQHAAVVQSHARAIRVEDADDARLQPVVGVVGHRHGLLEALGLVVDAARADRVDVAPVLLRLRVHGRVAVDLAGRRDQDARVLRLGEAEAVVDAERADLQRLDRDLQVVDRRGRRREVQDVVERSWHMDEVADVLVEELELLQREKVLEVPQVAGDEIVHPDHFIAFADEAIAEVRTEEAGGAGDQDAWHIELSHSVHFTPMPL